MDTRGLELVNYKDSRCFDYYILLNTFTSKWFLLFVNKSKRLFSDTFTELHDFIVISVFSLKSP